MRPTRRHQNDVARSFGLKTHIIRKPESTKKNVTPTLPGNEVTWTLSVELLFYALFPLLGRIAVRLRTRWLALATGLGLLGMWAIDWFATAHFSAPHASWVMRNPIVYLPEFLLGLTVAIALQRGWRLPLRPFVPIVLLGAYVIAYYQGRMRLPHAWVNQLDFTVRQMIAIFCSTSPSGR